MTVKKIDLSKYKEDPTFYPEIRLIITIKSFDLQAIRERYLKNRNKISNRTGSVNRRETARGGVAELTIKNGKITHQEVLTKLPEPRGIDSFEDITSFSSENKVHILKGEKLKTLTNPWFSYIHTVDINRKDTNRLLISSSGFDCIFEYSIEEEQNTLEWFAWENDFDHGRDPDTGEKLYLTRNKDTAAKFEKEGKKYILIDDPAHQVLPTAKRAAFINSVVYDPTNENNIIGTFFHEGAVYQISRETGKAVKVLDQLKNPHGGMKLKENNFTATSTASGEIVTGTIKKQNRYTFENLKGKPDFLKDMEWVQNTKIVGKNFIAIDSNRNSFIIINTEKKLISTVPYNPNWAIQDIVVSHLNGNQKYIIKNITD
ncbi:MAG: hypothetical protein ACQER7_05835 [Bacteroidota bacterium]